jgi:hypothetical protein
MRYKASSRCCEDRNLTAPASIISRLITTIGRLPRSYHHLSSTAHLIQSRVDSKYQTVSLSKSTSTGYLPAFKGMFTYPVHQDITKLSERTFIHKMCTRHDTICTACGHTEEQVAGCAKSRVQGPCRRKASPDTVRYESHCDYCP